MRLLRLFVRVMLICLWICITPCQYTGSNELHRSAYSQICNVWMEMVAMIVPSSPSQSTSRTRLYSSSQLLSQTAEMMELTSNSSALLVEELTLSGSHSLSRSCESCLEMWKVARWTLCVASHQLAQAEERARDLACLRNKHAARKLPHAFDSTHAFYYE